MGSSGGGVVTFLFTDLVDSTRTLAKLGDDAAERLRQAHFVLLRGAVAASEGEEVKNLGDGLMVAFASPLDAVAAAVRIQEAVAGHSAGHPEQPLAVRVGLHAGEPVREEGDYFGTPVVVAKRLCDAARGGQILAGEVVATLVGTRGAFRFRPAGRLDLKGLARPVPAVEVEWGSATPAPAAPRVVATGVPRRARAAVSRGPRMVGRTDELAALDDEFTVAASGQFGCVLLVGEPGMGKTRLAAELMARQAGKAVVVSARAHPITSSVPFGLWAEALDPCLQLLGDDEVADLCGGFLDDLAGLFHRVAAVRGTAGTGDAPRPRLLAGLARMIGNLARRAPVLVLLDDVHWADASSWEVLRHLARQLDDAPVLVLATARPVELAEQDLAGQVLFELDQDGMLSRLEVGALQSPELRELAEAVTGAPPPPALVGWLDERSQGNPLFALGLLRALMEERADLAAPALRRLPENLAERVLARYHRGEASEREMAELLAVAGRPLSLTALVALTGRGVDELGPILAAAVRSRAVQESERGRELTYQIAHPLVRDVIYEAMGGLRRRVLHRQAGRALRDAGRVAEAALHFARSAEPGDPEAVEALIDAMRGAEVSEAHREALGLLAELVELLPASDARWLDVLAATNWRAEWVVDHRADTQAMVAVQALRAMDALLSAGEGTPDPAQRAVVKFRLANFLAWGTGETAEAAAHCAMARTLFEEAGDVRHALLAARELAWIRGIGGDLRGMQAEAAAVVVAADAVGDRFVALQALSAVAYCAWGRGHFQEWETAASRAVAIAREDDKAYRLSVLQANLALGLAFQGRLGEANALVEEALRQDPRHPDGMARGVPTMVGWVAGDYPAAAAAAREFLARVPSGLGRRGAPVLVSAALSCLETEDEVAANGYLDRAKAVLGGREFIMYAQFVAYAEALREWRQGRPALCVARLRPVCERLREMEAFAFGVMVDFDLAEAAAEAHDAGAAAFAADHLARFAASTGVPLHDGFAATAGAHAELAEGRPAEAAERARSAVALLTPLGCRAHLGRAHVALGRALLPSDREAGVASLETAARILADCGATWRRGRVLDLLRRQGGAGRRAAAAVLGPGSLSPRERDVARLAAQGRSAKDIAEALFVGERTVESHLGRIYAKLGVESKLDLVRRAAELGLA